MKRLSHILRPAKVLYNWTRDRLERVEFFTDVEQTPEIPQASSAVQRLKKASDKAHWRKANILSKLKRRL